MAKKNRHFQRQMREAKDLRMLHGRHVAVRPVIAFCLLHQQPRAFSTQVDARVRHGFETCTDNKLHLTKLVVGDDVSQSHCEDFARIE